MHKKSNVGAITFFDNQLAIALNNTQFCRVSLTAIAFRDYL
ncbi:MAG: hypothetical protein RMZ41_030680 [Nostoc sp. DedVER02]|nr:MULTISPECIES: hypothetical protein [unclassified Nostoc]MDZ7984435.1 hypothetical protein [Nostoc sp. DedVER02]MDZ8110766.1 hypothetical protein [Nostoc sp. DedVER01b]